MTAVDNAPAMLSPDRTSAIRWVAADIADWRPAEPQQLIFSNAALNWLDDHPVLIPELIECLAPGGVLALQMPRNYGAPSHRAIVEVANSGPWAGRLEPLLRPHPVARPQDYFDLLAPLVQTTDIWETEYLHVLDGEDAVATWVEGTTLGPLVAALDGNDREAFRAAFRDRLKADYPPRPDGTTLFPFRRLFVVAVR